LQKFERAAVDRGADLIRQSNYIDICAALLPAGMGGLKREWHRTLSI